MDRGMEMGQDGEPSGAAPLREPKTALNAHREALADLCHRQWSGWMEYLFSKCVTNLEPGCMILPRWAVDRWKRQAAMEYADLPEHEKNSDRKEADRFIALLEARSAPEPAPGEGSLSHPSGPSQDSQEVRGNLEAARDLLIPVLYAMHFPDMEPGEFEESKIVEPWYTHWSGQADRVLAMIPSLSALLSQSPKGAAGADRELRRAATEIIASPSFLEPGTNPPILTVSVAQVSMDRLRACLQTVPQEDAENTVAECAFDLIRAMQRIRYNHCNINGLVAEYKECPTPICPDCQRGWGIHYATCSKAGGDGPSAPKTGLRGAAAPGDVVPPDYDKDRDPMGYFNA